MFTQSGRNVRTWTLCGCAALALAFAAPALAQPVEAPRSVVFEIQAQSLASALSEFARQSGRQLLFSPEIVEGKTANAVVGELDPVAALDRLLAGSGLTYSFTQAGAILLHDPSRAEAPSPTELGAAEEAARRDAESGIPEILVTGRRTSNTGIRRSEDDAQPYVVFDRTEIARSGASTVEDFLRQQAHMNSVGVSSSQGGGDTRSRINLRGLGADETLVLVDGRRIAGAVTTANTPEQGDINGIPIGAIERIEILPTTASGIHGGSATGGVVNIVLRRDYTGLEAAGTYENTFESDVPGFRLDLNGGFSFGDNGATSVLLAVSQSETDALRTSDRDYLQRGRAAALNNNPDALLMFGTFPPLGLTPNIRSTDGSPLFGPGTPSFTSVPVGYAGGGGPVPLMTNAGRYNLDPAESAQTNGGGRRDLLPVRTNTAFIGTLRHRFSPNIEGFMEAAHSSSVGENVDSNVFSSGYLIDADAPNNPFGQAVFVTIPINAGDRKREFTTTSDRLVGGAIFRLPHRWSVAFDYTWDRSRIESSNIPPLLSGGEAALIGNGSIDVLRDLNAFPQDLSAFFLAPSELSPFTSTAQVAALRFSGPLIELPAGDAVLSGLLEHRDEALADAFQRTPFVTLFNPDRSQSVTSLYVELNAPIASTKRTFPWARLLEVQVAGRVDEYTVNGSQGVLFSPTDPVDRVKNTSTSINPTVALRYAPVPDLTFRASYGTGFLPPGVTQLTRGAPFPSQVIDPRRGGEVVTVETLNGGNPDLRPEESESWSVGAILTPRLLSGLRISVDWTRIAKQDNIATPFGSAQLAVENEAVVPDLVERAAPAPGDPFDIGPIVSVDTSLANIARTDVEALDFNADYELDTSSYGSFSFSARGTWAFQFETQINPAAPVVDQVGLTTVNPQDFRGSAQFAWEYGDWTLGWTARYFDSYKLDTSLASLGPAFDFVTTQGSARVSSVTYHDLFGSYRMPEHGAELRFGVRNLFGTSPPLDVSNSVSFYSTLGDPRGASYYITVQKTFW